MQDVHDKLTDLPAETIEQFRELDPNIPRIIEALETLPHNSDAYFYFRNLLAAYIRAKRSAPPARDEAAT